MFHKIILPLLMLLVPVPFAMGESLRVENPAGKAAMAPGLANLPDGSTAILSWIESDDDQHVLKFSRFESGEFSEPREIARGGDWFANWADTPGIHVRSDRTWIAHWLEKSADSTYAYDIRFAQSSDAGHTWSRPKTPHTDGTPTEHGFVSYFSAGNLRTGMVWLDGRETLSSGPEEHAHTGFMTLRTAMIDADGAPGPTRLLDERVCDCCQTASAMTALGPIVVYRNRTEDEIRDIAVVRRTADGWTEPKLVHADGWKIGGCPVNGPSLIADDMQVVAAWFTMADANPRVRFAVSTNAGASFAPPVTLSPGTALGRVQLAWVEDGFVLGWMEDDGNGARLRIARYSLDGALQGQYTLGGVERGRVSGFPRIATVGDKLLVAWTATGSTDGSKGRSHIATALIDLQSAKK